MCCDSDAVRRRNKPGYMRGTPSILGYREAVTISRCGQSAGKADLARDRNPQRLHAGLRTIRSDDDTVHAPWRHGEHVNKVSVGEPADGSPPKSHQAKEALAR